MNRYNLSAAAVFLSYWIYVARLQQSRVFQNCWGRLEYELRLLRQEKLFIGIKVYFQAHIYRGYSILHQYVSMNFAHWYRVHKYIVVVLYNDRMLNVLE